MQRCGEDGYFVRFVYFMSPSSRRVPRDAQPGSASIDLVKYTKREDSQNRGEHPLEMPWLNSLATAEGHGQVQAAGSQ